MFVCVPQLIIGVSPDEIKLLVLVMEKHGVL